MQLTIKLKPVIMQARSKEALLHNIGHRFSIRGHAFSSSGNYMCSSNGDKVVYNMQKVRAKFERSKKRIAKRPIETPIFASRKIRDGHWLAYVYVFTKDAPVILRQGLRTVDISVKSNAFKI